MLQRLCLLALLASLVACQGSNPYQVERLPYPPAGDPLATRQADPGSYPPQREFGYHSHWQWAEPVEAALGEIVSAELDRRGLRPASAQSPASLALRVQRASFSRQRLLYDDFYLGAGFGHFHDHHGYWTGAPYRPLRSVSERVEQVQLEFLDAGSGVPLWQGTGEAVRDGREADALRRAVRRALDGFPPP